MAFATAESRIVLTLNRRHFIRLHQAMPDHRGIIVCTYDPDFEALAGRIHRELETYSDWRSIGPNQPAGIDAPNKTSRGLTCGNMAISPKKDSDWCLSPSPPLSARGS